MLQGGILRTILLALTALLAQIRTERALLEVEKDRQQMQLVQTSKVQLQGIKDFSQLMQLIRRHRALII